MLGVDCAESASRGAIQLINLDTNASGHVSRTGTQ